jgi:protein-tyrosine phosphatase
MEAPALRVPPPAPRVDFLPAAVLGAPGRLGLTCAPGRWWPGRAPDSDQRLREDLSELVREHGARVLVTLLEQAEIDSLGDVRREARRAGLAWLHLPIPDMWIPGDLAAARRLVARVLLHLDRGEDVIIHCWAGLGRSGTMAAACLVARGLSPAAAMAAVRAARGGAIQSEAQEQFVREFALDGRA